MTQNWITVDASDVVLMIFRGVATAKMEDVKNAGPFSFFDTFGHDSMPKNNSLDMYDMLS